MKNLRELKLKESTLCLENLRSDRKPLKNLKDSRGRHKGINKMRIWTSKIRLSRLLRTLRQVKIASSIK